MSEVTPLAATVNPTTATPRLLSTTLLPWGETHLHAHTILITIIFGVVCFLLLLTLVYAFCLHFSIKSSPKDSQSANKTCSLDREDTTYRFTSSENMGNVV